MAKTIKISNYVYEKLTLLKKKEGHTSYDSAIRELLNNYEGVPEYRRQRR